MHYNFLKYHTKPSWALLGCAILLSSNLFLWHSHISYRDFTLMFFNCSTIILILIYNQIKESKILLLAGLFAGFASFTKLEGTAFLIIYFILLTIIFIKEKIPLITKFTKSLYFSIPSITIAGSYHIYKIINKATIDGTGANDKTKIDFNLDKLKSIPEILSSFTEELLISGNWGVVWGACLISLIFLLNKSVKKNETTIYILISILLFIGLYSSISLLTANYDWISGHLRSAGLPRLCLHFFPLSSLFLIIINYNIFNNKK